jgi:excisionase family DNA binding protein
MKKDTREFYLVEELAERLRVSKMTIYRYIKAGKLMACKIGKEFRIEENEFNHFIKSTRNKVVEIL